MHDFNKIVHYKVFISKKTLQPNINHRGRGKKTGRPLWLMNTASSANEYFRGFVTEHNDVQPFGYR
jgi:hypothetical protein